MKLVKAGLMALAVVGLFAGAVEDAAAVTKCREVISHGQVVKRTCTTKPAYHNVKPAYRTVCNTYWRHGVKHRDCRRVYY